MHLPGEPVLSRVGLAVCLSSSYLLSQQPNSRLVEQYSDEGAKALAQQRYLDAERAYEKLRQLEPQVAEIHANLGLIYFQEKKFEPAVTALRQALKLKPALSKADTLLAMSLSELGRFGEALPGLERGFRQSNEPETKRLCGLQLERAYTGLHRDREATEVALELTRIYPNDPEVLYHSARLIGNFAYLTIQKLQEVAPTSPWMRLALGDLDESQGHYDLAISEYRQVLAVDPRRPGIHFRLGRTLLARSEQAHATGDRTEAMREFQQELDLDPTNANAAYELGEIYRKSGERSQAEELFGKALKYYPEFEEAQVGLARVLIAQGKPELALPHLRKAVSLYPRDPVAYFHLSQVYKALGNAPEQQKALVTFQRLRSQKEIEEKSLISGALSPREVTKQELDPEAIP